MVSPTISGFWQGFAEAARGAVLGFAKLGCVGQAKGHAGCSSYGPRLCLDCTPSLAVRPAFDKRRPDLFSGCFADGDARAFADHTKAGSLCRRFPFIAAANTVESRSITTLRGNEPCVNILSFLFLRPPAFPAVLRRRPSAAWSVLWPVRRLPTRPTRTWSPVRRWAVWPVQHPAGCRGCRPAAATDLTAACGQPDTTSQRPSGQHARVAFVISASRPGRGARGERCSRRS